MTTVLEVWGTLLDDNMQKDDMYAVHDNMPALQIIYKGSRGCEISVNGYVVESEDELWVLRGGPEPFLLRKCPGEYRLAQGAHWLLLRHDLTQGELKDFIDEAGHLHTSKLNLTRIIIF